MNKLDKQIIQQLAIRRLLDATRLPNAFNNVFRDVISEYELSPVAISQWDREHNPYLEMWSYLNPLCGDLFSIRLHLVQAFAYALPDFRSLNYIMQNSPDGILEIGGGSGYWASLLTQLGADIVSYDNYSTTYIFDGGRKLATFSPVYYDVVNRSYAYALSRESHERSLLLCWPDHNKQWCEEMLRLYTGSRIFYVGEGRGGRTGTDRFHDMLDKDWRLTETLPVPQWQHINDKLFYYERQ